MQITKRLIIFSILIAVLTSTAAVFLPIDSVSVNAASNITILEEEGTVEQSEHEQTQDWIKTEMDDDGNYIKWIDLNIPSSLLEKTFNYTQKLNKDGIDFDFCEALAYIATKNGNDFNTNRDVKNLDTLVKKVKEGNTINSIYGSNKYYKYYLDCYNAIFSGIIGNYTESSSGENKFGVSGYFPLASGFWYNDYDDFGSSRSYGFKRRHLGHDLMGSVGTPIIAVEGGTVAELGWNQYGGWRVGIRSNDTKRYYYYAHLRKDKPFPADLKLGDTVTAGQVIGFLGNTGYSSKENVNMKSCKPHLHFGMQIIFDESQVKGSKEIWVDVYQICRFLSKYRAKVVKDTEKKEYVSTSSKTPV